MKKIILLLLMIIALVDFSSGIAQARGRYRSFRVGGYTSHGKGSHYHGGYVRSCHGRACKY